MAASTDFREQKRLIKTLKMSLAATFTKGNVYRVMIKNPHVSGLLFLKAGLQVQHKYKCKHKSKHKIKDTLPFPYTCRELVIAFVLHVNIVNIRTNPNARN